jgi:dipeptidyl-peptidase-4
MPRYDRYVKLQSQIGGAIDRGVTNVNWSADGSRFGYSLHGTNYAVDAATQKVTEGETISGGAGRRGGRGGRAQGRRGGPDRGRQFTETFSPDGKLKATSRDRNVYLSDADGKNEVAVTTDGSETGRIKYGTASWVYGEELEVREAMWFSPDGKKLAYYRFDESGVADYYITYSQLQLQDTLNAEPYPLVGQPNPVVGLFIYDIATKKSTKVDTDFEATRLGHYVYSVQWSPSGDELLYNRMDRKQDIMEFCAANRETGASRAIITEQRTDGWVEQNPRYQFLADGKRFIWPSDRSGWKNFYLYDITGKQLAQITNMKGAECENVERLDEANNSFFYTARDGDNPYKLQLHRVGLDGSGEKRLTDPKYNHTVNISPGEKYFVDVSQSLDDAPFTTLRDGMDGHRMMDVSKSDLSKFNSMGLRHVERFTFTAADGKTTCYGRLSFPSDFDASKKYPLLIFVYGGPESGGDLETYQAPNAIAELGFIVASMDGRNTKGRGRAFLTAGYRKLGITEIDDHAAGVRELVKTRRYIDGKRVGIQGTSYGGYFSALSILRYPDVYACSCASSPVTDFRLYDSVYTERYMGQPGADDNEAGYAAGSCMTYAKDLKGRLMLYYGTADNNVHPTNAIRLAHALTGAGKRYDMQVGADQGHSQVNSSVMWEFFVRYLILDGSKDALSEVWPSVKARRSKAG